MSKRQETKFQKPMLEQCSRHSMHFTFADCKAMCTIDAPLVSSDQNTFIESNLNGYFVLTNTWYLQVLEISKKGARVLRNALTTHGLISTIRKCSNYADRLIAESEGHDYFNTDFVPFEDSWLPLIVSECETFTSALQILRYPKRFSPFATDLLEYNAVQAFMQVNRMCVEHDKRGYNLRLIDRVRHYVHVICRGYVGNDNAIMFSPGKMTDSDELVLNKLKAYASVEPNLYDCPLYPISGNYGTNCYMPGSLVNQECHLRAVPKSYKTSRIIAKESVFRQVHLQRIRLGLLDCIKRNGWEKSIDFTNQERNQEAARIGSIDGSYATLDLSSASDSISRALFCMLFPKEVVSDVLTYSATHVDINCKGLGHRKQRLFMAQTSGSAITPALQSILFVSICMAANEYCEVWGIEHILPPIVYNDDIVVDSRVAVTTMEFLDRLGFTVNREKSFWTGNYRESCGVEYLNGIDTSAKYFPRKQLDFGPDGIEQTISSLISLQQRIFSCFDAQAFLQDIVIGLRPKMTSHRPYTECSDLWDDVPKFRKANAPMHGDAPAGIPEEYIQREYHLTLRAKPLTIDGAKPLPKGITSGDLALLEMWRYTHFLQHGPQFETSLDELLRVSKRPEPLGNMLAKPVMKWQLVRE